MLDKVIEIALAAGASIMEIYAKDFEVEYKDDTLRYDSRSSNHSGTINHQ